MLFDLPKAQPTKEASTKHEFTTSQKPAVNQHFEEGRLILSEVEMALLPDSITHFVTYGKWSSHQLIGHIAEQFGPSHLLMTTWSMTEDPCRALLMLREKGILLSARCILSERISERTPQVMQLAHNVFDEIKFLKLHAKITLIYNDDRQATIISSANLTRNSKMEAGIIDTSPNAFEFHKNWIENEFAKSK